MGKSHVNGKVHSAVCKQLRYLKASSSVCLTGHLQFSANSVEGFDNILENREGIDQIL